MLNLPREKKLKLAPQVVEAPYWHCPLVKIDRFYVCDLECTGLDPYRNEIITLSMSCCDRNGELDAIELKMRPETNFWEEAAEKAHGISRFEASRFPERNKGMEALKAFTEKNKQGIFVCHALKFSTYFDTSFLLAAYDRIDRRHDYYRGFYQNQSTLVWLRYLNRIGRVNLSEFNLKYLCEHFVIPLEHHDARSDRVACQKLFYIILDHIKQLEKDPSNGIYSSELFS